MSTVVLQTLKLILCTKMLSAFPGSSFFSDTEFLKKRVFLCRHYDIPLFINSKFGHPKNYNDRNKLFLKKQLERYLKIYKRTVETRRAKQCTVANNKELIRRSKIQSKLFVTPAPNRYKIKGRDVADIIHKQFGNKGPYSCFTGVRDKTSYYGHMATKVGYNPISTRFYYDIPSEMKRLQLPRSYFVMKIRKGSRSSQRTYMRSMLNDLTLCPKDSNLPGPDRYYPHNFVLKIKTYNSLNKKGKYRIFHPGAYIQDSERFTLMKPLQPGPGRYNPQPVASVKRGAEYREDVARIAEYQQWKLSPLYANYHRVKVCPNTCDAPKIRNIPGKGFTSVFKSSTKRLVDKPKATPKDSNKNSAKNNDKLPNMLDSQYIHKMCAPKREVLSIRVEEHKKPRIIKFNTTAKTIPRQKLRANKAVAFLSSCPRFVGGGGKDTFLANRITLTDTENSPSDIRLSKQIKEVTRFERSDFDRLLKLPQRYEISKADKIANDKIENLFKHFPKAKILLKEISFVENK